MFSSYRQQRQNGDRQHMVQSETGGDEANTHGGCSRNQRPYPQKQEPFPVPPGVENLRKCN